MNWQKFAKPISTENLSLKIPTRSDADELLKLRTNKIVDKYIKRDLNISDIEYFIQKMNSVENNSLFFIIRDNQEKEFLGTICLWRINEDEKCAEVGYELFPDFHGKGIMNEALKTIINLAFNEIGFEHLKACTHTDNVNSRKLLEKNNFIFKKDKLDPNKSSNVVYELNGENSNSFK